MTDMVQSIRQDLTDIPLMAPGEELFTDGSSFIRDTIKYVGAEIVTQDCD